MRITILQRYLTGWRGGVRVTMQLARCLSQAGHSVSLLGRREVAEPELFYPLFTGVRALFWQAAAPGQSTNFTEILMAERDLIWAVLPESDLFIASNCFDALALSGIGVRWVYYIQALEGNFYKSNPEKQKLAEQSYRQDGLPFAVSEYVSNRMRSDYAVRCIAIIPPAVGDEFLKTAPPRATRTPRTRDSIQILYVGSLSPEKGAEDLIQALILVRRKGRRVTLDIATQESPTLELPSWLPVTVHWPTSDSVLSRLYRDAHVVVYPSHGEAFGLVPIEAMACMTPTIIADSGGVRQYARDGDNTLLVPPSSPEAIAGALERLAEDGSLVDTIVANGRATAEIFTHQAMCEAWLKHIAEVRG